ncbi:MAG: seg, partial [Candidatus Paceibacter sp.]|nr:seg [Candidatus Paceibacter sp.]
ELAQTKASGVIRVYNDFSSAPQKLIANTRFETPGGLIFRISQPITIPGKSGDTPGSIDVAITADAIGPEYNVGYSDFTIPGFKGDAKYAKIYARSKTEVTGGFNGNRKKVDEAQVASSREKIRQELEASLIRQMQQNIPENFIFPKGAYFIEYQTLPNTSIDNGIELKERATFHGIMFKREDLAHSIATKVNGASSSDMTQNDLANTDSLAFLAKAVVSASSTPIWDSPTLPFTLQGTTTLISAIDTEKLKDELAGKPRKSLSAILASYPGIANAEVIMRPFWEQSFPVDKAEITIHVAKSHIPQ